MSTAESEPEEPTAEAADAEEPGERAEKAARLVLTVVAGLALWGLIAAFPWIAYVVVGILGTVGWQKIRAWSAARRGETAEPAEEPAAPDVGEALRRLVGDDKGVLLTALREDLKLPDTKAVKALLAAEGIPWKAGRTRAGNGPSVRREDIPAAPSPVAGGPHRDGCCCRSGGNTNSNNDPETGSGEGLRVVVIGNDGKIIYDPRDNTSHHVQ
ncbi:hypothetical protein [Streptomyces cylindrosporus]|uniref:Uncharacterized protein n=1 Tax=Streptomyces cylindrosporus TaxID=2927583 RepID=A0ABS9Y339_9ACTN|nr:hypothetical protein [Streptomyces cylindrosporus]MCI3271409.1 hypothetical protein [Streptomyces cylindrosporus]